MKRIIFLLLLITTSTFAYTPSSSAEFSILTCSPGKEIYKIYGHSAIRFQDREQGMDIVYNYGMFDFSAPHFMLRYIQGQNEYLLGREQFRRFKNRYVLGGEKVTQQILNLDSAETLTLFKALEENAKPKNRNYLYNVFYDNCATRIYRIIEDNHEHGVIWSEDCKDESFRSLMHKHNDVMPFSQMGIDIVFGIKADKEVTCMEQMFLPENLMWGLDKAIIANEEGVLKQRSLIKETKTLLEGKEIHNNIEKTLFNVILLLLLATTILARFKFSNLLRSLRIILFTLVGLSSLLVWYIAFFSIHPTVLPNLNFLWINPLWLIFAGLFIAKKQPLPGFRKILNLWSILMTIFIAAGLFGAFYLNNGILLIVASLVALSTKE
jgi:hypothetical protein